MRNSRSGRALAGIACALALGVVTGCSQDTSEAESSVGQVERTTTMTAANLAFVTAGEGTATLVGRLINDGEEPDRLVDVDAESEQGPLDVRLVGDPVVVEPTDPARLGREPSVVAELEGLQPGLRVELELSFERSAPISTTVTVESQTGPYADIEVPS